MNPSALGRSLVAGICLAAPTSACSDPAPPEPEVASIELSVPDTGASIRFRDTLIVRATPQAALGVPLVRTLTWTSATPALLSLEPMGTNGDSARVRASGVGTGQIRVSAGNVSKSFQVVVRDTVFSVVVTPGPLSLVAGDTVTFTAAVDGPPNADRAVRWEVSDAAVLEAQTATDPARRQARTAGSSTVSAISLADPTKTGSVTVTSQVGKLAFVQHPTAAQRDVPLTPVVSVEVQDMAGNRSARAANTITLSQSAGGCTAQSVGGTTTAQNGLATFPRLALDARCASATLTASASPNAAPATTPAFSIAARSCGAVVPFALGDTIHSVVEAVDCVVVRDGRGFTAHTYEVTIPAAPTFANPQFRISATSSVFAPLVQSHLWAQDPAVAWSDSLTSSGTLDLVYSLPAGTHRFVVNSPVSGGTGQYSWSASAPSPGGGGLGSPCLIRTAPGVTISSSLDSNGDECIRPFVSRSGDSPGRHFLLYLRPGKSIQVTYRPTSSGVGNDAYLELFDVTATSTLTGSNLIGSDDNSGGGALGLDAQFTVDAAPTGRFILIRTARVFRAGGSGTSFFNLTITP